MPERSGARTKRRRSIFFPKKIRLCGKSLKLDCCGEMGRYRLPLILLLTIVAYVAVGGLIFLLLEQHVKGRPGERVLKVMDRISRHTSDACSAELHNLVAASPNVSLLHRANISFPRNIIDDEWHYGSAFLFAFSVVTTIGYGNVSPESVGGRVFCIFYAIIGIPLNYLGIAVIGRLFAEIALDIYIKWRIWSHVRMPKIFGNELSELPSRLPLNVIFSIFICWIILGTLLLPLWERPMSVFEACYFIIISLTTIGLGDIYPGKYDYFAITYMYLTMGLAITTMLIDALADYLRKIQYVGRIIKDFGRQYVYFGGDEIQVGRLISDVLRQLPLSEAEKQAALMNVEGMIRTAVYNNAGPGRRSVFDRFPFYGAVQPEALEYMGIHVGYLRFMDEEWFNSWSNYNTWLKEVYNVDSIGLSLSRDVSNLTSEATHASFSRSEISGPVPVGAAARPPASRVIQRRSTSGSSRLSWMSSFRERVRGIERARGIERVRDIEKSRTRDRYRPGSRDRECNALMNKSPANQRLSPAHKPVRNAAHRSKSVQPHPSASVELSVL